MKNVHLIISLVEQSGDILCLGYPVSDISLSRLSHWRVNSVQSSDASFRNLWRDLNI